MIRRPFSFAVGFGLGMYAARQLRRVPQRLAPASLRQRVGTRVRAAREEGRAEARRRELALRRLLARPSRVEPVTGNTNGTGGTRVPHVASDDDGGRR